MFLLFIVELPKVSTGLGALVLILSVQVHRKLLDIEDKIHI